MPKLTASVSLLDLAPARELYNICREMIADDRVPAEYKLRIIDAVRPHLDDDPPEQIVTVE